MTAAKVNLPESLGFRNGTSNVHTSRTMMLEELALLLDKVGPDKAVDAYLDAIKTDNVLGQQFPASAGQPENAVFLTTVFVNHRSAVTRRLHRFGRRDCHEPGDCDAASTPPSSL